MIGIIHSNWDSDIVLEEGELEEIISGKVLFGDIVNYNELGELFLSMDKNEFATSSYFNLNWNKKEPLKYNFKVSPLGVEKLQEINYVHGRYENGFQGSKLTISGHEKDNLTKENIEFAIQMIKLDKENN